MRHVRMLLRQAFTHRATWALCTVEWMDGVAAYIRTALGRTRVLEVCAGHGVLAQPMRARGLEWAVTDSQQPPADLAVGAPVGVSGALEAVRGSAVPPEVVFWSWWDGKETDEDYLLCEHCWSAGIPVLFVGEGRGGCTGSAMFWSAGMPLRRLVDVVPGFVDVAQWEGCTDETWCLVPPAAACEPSAA